MTVSGTTHHKIPTNWVGVTMPQTTVPHMKLALVNVVFCL